MWQDPHLFWKDFCVISDSFFQEYSRTSTGNLSSRLFIASYCLTVFFLKSSLSLPGCSLSHLCLALSNISTKSSLPVLWFGALCFLFFFPLYFFFVFVGFVFIFLIFSSILLIPVFVFLFLTTSILTCIF